MSQTQQHEPHANITDILPNEILGDVIEIAQRDFLPVAPEDLAQVIPELDMRLVAKALKMLVPGPPNMVSIRRPSLFRVTESRRQGCLSCLPEVARRRHIQTDSMDQVQRQRRQLLSANGDLLKPIQSGSDRYQDLVEEGNPPTSLELHPPPPPSRSSLAYVPRDYLKVDFPYLRPTGGS